MDTSGTTHHVSVFIINSRWTRLSKLPNNIIRIKVPHVDALKRLQRVNRDFPVFVSKYVSCMHTYSNTLAIHYSLEHIY